MRRLDLDKIQVTSPCATDWQGMKGDDKTRFCDCCNKRVYNLSAMTRLEVEALVRETDGRFCARVMRDADGSIITASENAGLNLMKFRASKFASAVVSAALSLSPLALTTANANPSQQVQSERESKHDSTVTNAQGGTAKLYGKVYDPNGAVVPWAILTLTNEKTHEYFVKTPFEEGSFQFNDVPAGTYELKVESLGFVTQKTTNLELQANVERRIDVTLQVSQERNIGVVVIPENAFEESLDTIKIPELLLHPIKAIQLRVKEQNKKPVRKRKIVNNEMSQRMSRDTLKRNDF